MKMIIEQNIKPGCEQFNAQKWRRQCLWTEAVDNVLKAYLPLLTHVYENFGGKFIKPGQKVSMAASEFENFVMSVPLLNESFNQRDANACYNLAMMT